MSISRNLLRFSAATRKEAGAEGITRAKALIVLFMFLAIEDFIKTRIPILLFSGEIVYAARSSHQLLPWGRNKGVRAKGSEAFSFLSFSFPFLFFFRTEASF